MRACLLLVLTNIDTACIELVLMTEALNTGRGTDLSLIVWSVLRNAVDFGTPPPPRYFHKLPQISPACTLKTLSALRHLSFCSVGAVALVSTSCLFRGVVSFFV